MGKADKNKKYSKFLSNNTKSSTNSNKTNGHHDISTKTHQSVSKYQSVVSDLNSLLEDKRYRACSMVSDIIASQESNNNTTHSVLETYGSMDVLNKLNLRCVDTSERVRVAAITALRNISSMGDETINGNIVKMGLPVALIQNTSTLIYNSCHHTDSSVDCIIRQYYLDQMAQSIICKAHFIEQVVGTICNIRYINV